MEEKNTNVPVLALRGLTIFPNMLMHFDVERDISVKALEAAMENNQDIFLVAQREIATEEPGQKDLYSVGTVSHIRQILRVSEGNVRVMIEGKSRARLKALLQTEPYLLGEVELLQEREPASQDTLMVEALLRQCYSVFGEYHEAAPRMSTEVLTTVLSSRDPGYLADYIAQNTNLRHQDKQAILEEFQPLERLKNLNGILARELEVLSIEQDLEGKVRERLGRMQKDYILREQLKVLQEELGEGDPNAEAAEYQEKILTLHLPEEIEEKLLKEVERMAKQPYGSAEGSVLRNYLDVCLELPWNQYNEDRTDMAQARKLLDRDHFGLQKVKERILEHLAVRQINPDAKGQILCLVGPPGVGKTSIAISVAEAMNRKLARLSLGGVRDEAEIRGHRKTYVGAMPGRIVNALIQCGSMNPLMVLDEVDKLGNDYRGDPSAALLEVLDSAQNSSFRDHYLEIPLDLSKIMFITTANTTDTIPRPLLDRMEVIELSSYTDEEKVQIAKRYLLPKQMELNGIKRTQLRISDAALRAVIDGYTRESGVRRLDREMGRICRKTAIRLVEGEEHLLSVTPKNLQEILGPVKVHPEVRGAGKDPGVVTGLAWTAVGGELLEVEVNLMDGSGKLECTGNLGDVMKESIHIAVSCLRSRAKRLGIDPGFYKEQDIHVHFPEGAIPKDGPSAGITITTAIVSALTEQKVRRDLAMTGEISLHGRVLPIGGLREKTMAALRNGVKTVIIPKDNVPDLEEIDPSVRVQLTFVPVETIDEVLAEALPLEALRGKGKRSSSAAMPGKRERKPRASIRQ
ncbi:MAG: endopeptidase La [Clostridiales bacterium]|nr:endopeptidase La [Clostridiales bacterium]MDY4035939.1 endopeptidase La [Candidatus Pseudoscilispira sp.]